MCLVRPSNRRPSCVLVLFSLATRYVFFKKRSCTFSPAFFGALFFAWPPEAFAVAFTGPPFNAILALVLAPRPPVLWSRLGCPPVLAATNAAYSLSASSRSSLEPSFLRATVTAEHKTNASESGELALRTEEQVPVLSCVRWMK